MIPSPSSNDKIGHRRSWKLLTLPNNIMRVTGEALKRPFQMYERRILHHNTSWVSSRRYISCCRNLQSPVTTAFSRLESSSSSFCKYSYPSLGSCPSSSHWDHLSITAVVAAAGGLLTGTTAHCEEEEKGASSNTRQQDIDQSNDDDEEEQDADPAYENLPEHDEETTCLLCKTHRQGPCRRQWRNFEYCVKDLKRADDGKSSSSSASKACDCYILPFEKCWMKNLNLYVLIANTVNQELVEDIEQDFLPFAHLQRAFAHTIMPTMDWSKWLSHLQTASTTKESNNSIVLEKLVEEYETKMSSSSSANKHLWEYFDEMHLEPNLVTVTSQIPIRIIQEEEDDMSSLILRFVYAVDQDNHAVGYSEYNSGPSSPPQQEQDGNDKKQEGETQEQQQQQQQHHVLALCLLPGITRAVRISAVYAKESSPSAQKVDDDDASSADETPTVFLFTTPWTFLPSISSATDAA